MNNFQTKMKNYVEHIEMSLPKFLPTREPAYGKVIDAMKYSLCGGGKRVRGVFVLAFYELFGGKNIEHALPFAAAMEMIHAYSLIHDDLPCMDDDDIRRGKPACHIEFGEATALLAGDGLLTLAFGTLLLKENLGNFDSDKILEAVKVFSVAAGVTGMIGGQVMDLNNQNRDLTGEVLEATDTKKTGALFMAAAQIGAVLAGAVPEHRSIAETFGRKVGLAFQIVDDILDVTSDSETLGKPVGSDNKNSKNTYTSIYGVGKAREMVKALTYESKNVLNSVSGNTSFLNNFTDVLAERSF